LSTAEDNLFRKEIAMTKFRKLITPLLITVIICATLALGYQQDPLRLPNPFSGVRPTPKKKDKPGLPNPFYGPGQAQERNDHPAELKDLYLRISKLESKVTQLEKRIEELQKPRVLPANQK